MTQPLKGQLLIPRDDSRILQEPHLVVDIDVAMNRTALLPIKSKKLTSVFKLSEISDAVACGDLVIGEQRLPRHVLAEKNDSSGSGNKLWKLRIDRLEDLVNEPTWKKLLYGNDRGILIRRHAESMKVKPPNIYPLLRLHMLNGMTPNALYPAFERCGKSKGVRFREASTPIGNKSQSRRPHAQYVMSLKDHERFKLTVKQHGDDENLGIAGLYTTALREHYPCRYECVNGAIKRVDWNVGEIPSGKQFRHWFNKTQDLSALHKRQIGAIRWEKDFRALHGSGAEETIGAGDRFQTDTMTLGGSLVSVFDHHTTIGAPRIVFVSDVATGPVVGFHVALENAKYDICRIALFNSFTSKVDFCARYGVTITPDEWPMDVLCSRLLMDRGENFNSLARGIRMCLGIETELAASGRGDLKGLIERAIGVYKGLLVARIPGIARRRMRERGKRDPYEDACLTLDALVKILIKLILHYNKTRNVQHLLTRQMMQEGVKATPNNLWNWSIRNGIGSPRRMSSSAIAAALLPRITVSVHKDGIHRGKLRYTCARAIKEKWFEKAARTKSSSEIEVHHHPYTSDYIVVPTNDPEHFDVAHLIKADKRFAALAEEELDELLDREARQKRELEYEELSDGADTDADIEQLVTEEVRATKQARSKNPKHTTRINKALRDKERDLRRAQEEAFTSALVTGHKQNERQTTTRHGVDYPQLSSRAKLTAALLKERGHELK